MRRTPLTRRAPIARGKVRLARGGPLPAVNPERRRRLHERNFGDKATWIRSLPCTCGRAACRAYRSDAAHVVARGMGGCGGDKRHLVPLSRPCHLEQERVGVEAFGRAIGVDLAAEAERLDELWRSRT